MKGRTFLVLVVAVAVVAAFLFRDIRQGLRVSEPPTIEPALSTAKRVRSPLASARIETSEQIPEPPVIDELSLEKQEVCRGEDNAIHVRAHARDRNGSDGFLTMSTVHPETGKTLRGSHLPFQLDSVGRHEFVVVADSIGGVTTAVLSVMVKDCITARSVKIHVERTLEAPDVVVLRVELAESGELEKLIAPLTYSWDFGDGSTEETDGPRISHSYEAREQTSTESSFLVRIAIEDSRGESVESARSVAFGNPAFLALHEQNLVTISVGVTPRTETQPEQIRLYHGYGKTVHIERVRMRETVLDRPDAPERETFVREYRPSELLGTSELPARAVTMLPDLSALQPHTPTAVRYIEVHGHTDDGRLASATFTLLPAKN